MESGIDSVFLPIIAIICCLSAFCFYLQRLELPHLADSMWQEPEPIPETKVTSTTLPFKVKICDKPSFQASMRDGLRLQVEALVASTLQSFWCVSCQGLTEALWSCDMQQWSHDCLEEKLLENSISSSDKLSLDSGESREVHQKIGLNEEGSNENRPESVLGPAPRSRYPLVFLMRQGHRAFIPESPSVSIACVLWVFHLPDEIVTEPCHVISQLIITTEGRVCNLEKMFVESQTGECAATSMMSPTPSSNGNNILGPTQSRRHLSRNGENNQQGLTDEGDSTCPNTDSLIDDPTSPNTRRGDEIYPNIDSHPSCPDAGDASHDPSYSSIDRSCAVCQNAPISRTILPCRHACVCGSCLAHLMACPMCRGPITSHFKLSTADDESVVQRELDWVMRIQYGMERLNEWLGFT